MLGGSFVLSVRWWGWGDDGRLGDVGDKGDA